jgi:hypothetical protein
MYIAHIPDAKTLALVTLISLFAAFPSSSYRELIQFPRAETHFETRLSIETYSPFASYTG